MIIREIQARTILSKSKVFDEVKNLPLPLKKQESSAKCCFDGTWLATLHKSNIGRYRRVSIPPYCAVVMLRDWFESVRLLGTGILDIASITISFCITIYSN
jgi:hypothetical protein